MKQTKNRDRLLLVRPQCRLALSDAEKSCERILKPGEGNQAFSSLKFQKNVQLLDSLQHEATNILPPPRKYQLVATLLANSLKTMAMLLSLKIMAMLIAYLRSALR